MEMGTEVNSELEALRKRVAELEAELTALRMEYGLRRREQEAREMLHAGEDPLAGGYWELDLTTNIVRGQLAWARLLGLPPGKLEIHAREFVELLDPEAVESATAAHVAHIKGRTERIDMELPLIVQGERRWIRTRARVSERDPNGVALRMVGLNIDVSAERLRSEEVAHQRELLEAVFRTSTSAITVLDPSGHLVLANDAAKSVLGLSASEAVQRTYDDPLWKLEAVDGSPLPKDQLPFFRIARTHQPITDYEHAIRWPDGSRRLLSVSGAPILADGVLKAAVFTVTDITEIRQREEERLVRETNLSLSARLAGLYYWVWDLDPDTLTWPDTVHHLFGASRSKLTNWRQVFALVDPEDRDRLWEALQEASRTGNLRPVDFTVLHSGGRRRCARAVGTLTYDRTGRQRRLVGALLDITTEKAAASRLLESIHRFETIGNNLPSGAVYRAKMDRSGGIVWTYVSAGVRNILGIEAGDLMANPQLLYGMIDKGDLDRMIKEEARAAELQIPYQCEVRIRLRTGERRWITFRAAPSLVHETSVTWDGIMVDETPRRLAEEARRETEFYFENMLANLPGLVYVLDEDNQFMYANEATERLLGVASGELLGTPLSRYSSGTVLEQLERHNKLVLNENRALSVEEVFDTPDAHLVFQAVKFPLPVTSNGRRSLCGVSLDVTEAKRAASAIIESESRFQKLADSAPVLIWVSDSSGAINYFNKPWYEFVGREAYREGETWELDVHPEDVDRVRWIFSDHLREGKRYQIDYRLRHHSGDWRWVLEVGSPRLSGDGEVVGMIGTCVDVHDNRLAEQERRQMEEHYRVAQNLESLGVLAGGIAHDFNNLLMAILGNAEIARAECERGHPAEQALSDIITTARRAAELCRQMLTYAGRSKPAASAFELHELVREILQLLRVSIPRSVELKTDFNDAGNRVEADPVQIRQVVMNLVINASDAIGERPGRITIRTGITHLGVADLRGLHAAEQAQPGAFVRLEVLDTGCGMSPETMARIFEPFYTTKFTGRGLGLSAVLGTVKVHRGAFGVASVEGIGSTFTLFLPVTRSEAPDPVPQSDNAQTRGNGLVLVIDDEDSVRTVTCRVVERMGFQTRGFASGDEAIAAFHEVEELARGCIIDLTMPGRDGIQTAQWIRSRRPDIPVILVSGHGSTEMQHHVEGMPRTAFLPKPYSIPEISKVIRELFI